MKLTESEHLITSLSNTNQLIIYIFRLRLLSPDCLLLEELGKKFRHEIVVGLNGRVWINATTIANVLKIYDSISHLEHTPFEQVLQNVRNEFETVSNKKAKRQKN